MDEGTLIETVAAARRQLSLAEDAVTRGDWINACRSIGRVADMLPNLADEFAERAAIVGHTQKSIAIALGVPERALRGLKQSVCE